MSVKEALLSLPHVSCYMCKSSDGAAFREALCIECVCVFVCDCANRGFGMHRFCVQ